MPCHRAKAAALYQADVSTSSRLVRDFDHCRQWILPTPLGGRSGTAVLTSSGRERSSLTMSCAWAVAFGRGRQHCARCRESELLRRAGVLAGILARPFFLISIGLNTWASLGYLHQLGWEFRRRRAGPVAELAGARAVRLGPNCKRCHYRLLVVVLAVAVRDQLPQKRARGFAVVLLAFAWRHADLGRVSRRCANAEGR